MKAKSCCPPSIGNTRIPRLRNTGLLGMAAFLLALFLSPVPFAQSKEAEIFLLHTNNVTGHLFPCPT